MTRGGQDEKSSVKSSVRVTGSPIETRDRMKSVRLSSGVSNRIRPLDVKSHSVSDGSHGNVYLGSPHRKMSIDQGIRVNGSPLSSLTSDHEKDIFFVQSNPWKRIGRKVHPVAGKLQCPTVKPFFVRTERQVDEKEGLDSRNEDRIEDNDRRNSLISTDRLSRVSNESNSWVPDSSIARTQRTRRTKELLRQKSQEQILSKQRYFQNRVFQIEELGNLAPNSDSRALDEILVSRHAICAPGSTREKSLQSLDGEDESRDQHLVSDQESMKSDAASPCFTLQSASERIRFTY